MLVPTISSEGLAIVIASEGLRLRSYRDPVGIWTIGYGHTPAWPSETISRERALSLLRQDLAISERFVWGKVHDVPTTLPQFSAMVSLTFNIGVGGFATSSVLRHHRLARQQMAADAFLMWDKGHVDGQLTVLEGLKKRREKERALYLTSAKPIVSAEEHP